MFQTVKMIAFRFVFDLDHLDFDIVSNFPPALRRRIRPRFVADDIRSSDFCNKRHDDL